jgi:hypothetical protein
MRLFILCVILALVNAQRARSLYESSLRNRKTELAASAPSCSLQYSSFYEPNITVQVGSLNFVCTNILSEISAAFASEPPIRTLYDCFDTFFTTRPYVNGSYYGYELRADYESAWNTTWVNNILPLVSEGSVFGIWLGDEVCWNGVQHGMLAAAADLVKNTWPDAIVYYNEAEPVITNGVDLWGEDVGYSDVPASISWFSIDYYRLDNSSWLYPELVLYPLYIYELMHPSQCALTVPGSYGSEHDPSNPLSFYLSFMVEQANAYYNWSR